MLMPMLWNGNDDWFDNSLAMMDQAMNNLWGGNSLKTVAAMKTDVIEEDKDYKLEAELPGFKKEDIHIDMKNGALTRMPRASTSAANAAPLPMREASGSMRI